MKRALLALLLIGAAPAAQRYAGPIIDVHQHSYPPGALEAAPPLGAIRPDMPAAYAAQPAAATGAAQLAETLAQMRTHHVTIAIQSYNVERNGLDEEIAQARAIRTASGGAILAGVSLRPLLADTPPDRIAAAFRAGEVVALGEMALQYQGRTADDPALDRYWAMAEALDMPVAIHTGAGPPRAASHGTPAFRLRYGNPLSVEDVLVKHPRLRVSLMHAGYPYLEETKGMLQQYPEVYVDLGVIDWVLPPAEFYGYLKALVDAGFGDRIMFGSDQQNWPAAIGLAVETVNAAPFLTPEQKRAIFHDNAVRFYRLKG